MSTPIDYFEVKTIILMLKESEYNRKNWYNSKRFQKANKQSQETLNDWKVPEPEYIDISIVYGSDTN